LFSGYPVGTGGGNCVTIGLLNVRVRGADVEVDKTSSIDLFSVFLTVFADCSSSLQINLLKEMVNRLFLTNQQMQ
jgi:hypothetical protein